MICNLGCRFFLLVFTHGFLWLLSIVLESADKFFEVLILKCSFVSRISRENFKLTLLNDDNIRGTIKKRNALSGGF